MKTAKINFQKFLGAFLPRDPYSFPDIRKVIKLLLSNSEVLSIKYEIASDERLPHPPAKRTWHHITTEADISRIVEDLGLDGPAGDRITIQTKRVSDFSESIEYRMALVIMHIYAEQAGCTIVGNLLEDCTWTDSGDLTKDFSYYTLTVPYIHYGS